MDPELELPLELEPELELPLELEVPLELPLELDPELPDPEPVLLPELVVVAGVLDPLVTAVLFPSPLSEGLFAPILDKSENIGLLVLVKPYAATAAAIHNTIMIEIMIFALSNFLPPINYNNINKFLVVYIYFDLFFSQSLINNKKYIYLMLVSNLN